MRLNFSGTASALLATGVMLAAPPATAQTRAGFEAGVEVFDYNYRERDAGRPVQAADGVLAGFRLSYVAPLGRGFFLRGVLNAATGEVDYRANDGSLLENVDEGVGQFEVHAGKDFPLGAATLTAFAGLGVRTVRDDSGDRAQDAGIPGYDRRIAYGYVPLGLGVGLPLGRTRLLLGAQYNAVIGGEVESQLSDVDPALPDLKLRLPGGDGAEASAMLAVPLGRRELRVGPAFRYWSIDRSRSESIAVGGTRLDFAEPRSRTTEYLVRATLAF